MTTAEWWCTRCGGPADKLRDSIDSRYPSVKCRDCEATVAGVSSYAAAAAAARLVHDRTHAPGRCPKWCVYESSTPVGT